ncbi:hypothetical protein C486_10679 [Natrinema gari JCM 14663]|uniref:Uncharacterized protein n=1 Tax=Natrinema gari JCM 14663 TaxID=1230459 RepID=L9YZC7_9EURY|nr:hypothetical protein C486_10679 [Natrinema gari JCM 14663]
MSTEYWILYVEILQSVFEYVVDKPFVVLCGWVFKLVWICCCQIGVVILDKTFEFHVERTDTDVPQPGNELIRHRRDAIFGDDFR